MLLSHLDVYDIAPAHFDDTTVERQLSPTVDKGPHLLATVVILVADVATGLDAEKFGQGPVAVGQHIVAHHLVGTPAPLLIHGSLGKTGGIGFEAGARVLIAHQDSVGTGCHDGVFHAEAHNRYFQLIHHMGTVGAFAHDGIADGAVGHFLGEAVPGSEVFPISVERYDTHRRGFLHHLEIETDFGQFEITQPHLVEGVGLDITGNVIVEKTQFEGKDAPIPKSPFAYQLLGILNLGLFDETDYRINVGIGMCHVGNDITECRRRSLRADSHQHHIGDTPFGGRGHLRDDGKITFIGIGVDGHHHDNLVATALLVFEQMGRRQSYRGEGVATFGLGNHVDSITELGSYGIFLRHAGSDRDGGVEPRLLDLPHDALQHRLPRTVGSFEQFEELFGAGVVRQRPKAFSRAAR